MSQRLKPYLFIILSALIAVAFLSYRPIFSRIWDIYKGREVAFQDMTINLGSNIFVFPSVDNDYILLGVRNNTKQRFPESGRLMISSDVSREPYSFESLQKICKKTGCAVALKKNPAGFEWLEVQGSLLSFTGDYHVFFTTNNGLYDIEYHGPEGDYAEFRSTIQSVVNNFVGG